LLVWDGEKSAKWFKSIIDEHKRNSKGFYGNETAQIYTLYFTIDNVYGHNKTTTVNITARNFDEIKAETEKKIAEINTESFQKDNKLKSVEVKLGVNGLYVVKPNWIPLTDGNKRPDWNTKTWNKIG